MGHHFEDSIVGQEEEEAEEELRSFEELLDVLGKVLADQEGHHLEDIVELAKEAVAAVRQYSAR